MPFLVAEGGEPQPRHRGGGKATGGTACRKIIGKNMKIDIVEKLTPRMTEALVRLWEASVRATHDFLTESEIGRIGAYVPEALQSVRHLAVAREEDGSAAAFLGVEGRRIGMLFVAPEGAGRGSGGRSSYLPPKNFLPTK